MLPTPSNIQAEVVPDRILVVASPSRALELLRLAVLRSDDVVFVAETVAAPAKRFSAHFAIEVVHRPFAERDLDGASAMLVSLDDVEDENHVVRQARRKGVPVHVSDRPLVSDFSVLAMLEQPRLLAATAA